MATGCSEYNREAIEDNNAGMNLLRGNRFWRRARPVPARGGRGPEVRSAALQPRAGAHAAGGVGRGVSALTRAIARNPRNAEYHFQLGNAHFRQEHWEQARAAFNQAIQVAVNYYMAHYAWARWPSASTSRRPRCGVHQRDHQGAARLPRVRAPRALVLPRERARPRHRRCSARGCASRRRAPERGARCTTSLGNVLLEQGHREQAVEEFVAATAKTRELAEALFSAGYTSAEIPERGSRRSCTCSASSRRAAGATPRGSTSTSRRTSSPSCRARRALIARGPHAGARHSPAGSGVYAGPRRSAAPTVTTMSNLRDLLENTPRRALPEGAATPSAPRPTRPPARARRGRGALRGQKRWQDLIRPSSAKAELLVDVAERVALYERVAALYVERFSNQAEAIKANEHILEIDPENAPRRGVPQGHVREAQGLGQAPAAAAPRGGGRARRSSSSATSPSRASSPRR
jgi:tetratricopeptide (TPR) repeat protein